MCFRVVARVNTVRASGVFDFDKEGRFDMNGVADVRRSERNKERLNYKDMADGKGARKDKEQEQNREEGEDDLDLESGTVDTQQLGATGGEASGGEATGGEARGGEARGGEQEQENPLDLTDYNQREGSVSKMRFCCRNIFQLQ